MKKRTKSRNSKVSNANSKTRAIFFPQSGLFVVLVTLAVVLAMIGLSSCAGYTSSANSASTEHASIPDLSASTTSVNFGSIPVNSSASQSVTLTNTGSAAVSIAAPTIAGSGFSMASMTAQTINPGQSVSLQMTFKPASAATFTGNVSVEAKTSNSTLDIGLSGTGTNAEVSANPTSISFGSVAVGTTDSQPITLKNSGNMTVGFSNISVTGPGMSVAGISTSTTIAAGGSLTFDADFAPTSSGSATGSIAMTTNGSPTQLAISLTGTGEAATTLLTANPTGLSFGNVNDDTSSVLTTSLTNSGNSNVTISAITTSGAGFSASGVPNGTTLMPGQSTTLSVTFAPTAAGIVSGALISIASNSTTSPLVISLSGTGTHAVVLQWDVDSGATSYEVYRGTASGGEGTTPLNGSPISGTTYTDTNVTSGTTYFYTVKAVNSAGSSAASNEASAVIPTP